MSHERGVPAVVVEDLLPVSGAARRARDLITEWGVRWGLSYLIGPACVVASELVNNGVQHAGTMLTFSIRREPGSLYVAVHDGSPHLPALTPGGPYQPRLGLRLVDAVASRWGHRRTAQGKVVWATVGRDAIAQRASDGGVPSRRPV